MEQFREKFIDEANDLINELERVLLDLESNPKDMGIIEKVFRIMHSLKGGSAMFGFAKMDKFTHYLESIYDLVRNKKLEIDDKILDLTLASVDHLRNLIGDKDEKDISHDKENDRLMELIQTITSLAEKPKEGIQLEKDIEREEVLKTYYISFKPNSDIFKFGTNPLFLLDDLFQLGESKIFPRLKKIPEFDTFDPSVCYVNWDIFLATKEGINAVIDVFLFVDNQSKLEIQKLSDINLFREKSFVGIITETVKSNDEIKIESLQDLIHDLEKIYNADEKLKDEARITDRAVKDSTISSLRVSAEKLDNLINWVSELVTIQARLSLFAQENNFGGLTPIAEEVEKISRRLRDDVFSIRLIPIESMMTRFHRLVRELSHELKKEVVFKTEGTETELDKTIIENLTDPLMHIIRNSLDHGIEDAGIRERIGKPKQGNILFKAFYSGTNVYIQVSDDGKGIDIKKLKEKAIAKGFIEPEEELTDTEILNLVFLPGFSTAEKVTKLSGRGVGMDVVKRKISEIRGEVDIESHLGSGTTITIKLPLTLSIIDGLLVRIGTTHFLIPLSSVDKCYEFYHNQLDHAVNNLILAGNERVSFIYLRTLFEMEDTPPDIERIVVVEYSNMRIGLAVDHIVGEYQAVLKPLGKLYRKQDVISGATILGDGTVALVLDPNKLIFNFSKTQVKIGG